MSRTEKSRQIVERIVIEGTLKLITPTSLSNGDADGLTDISLIKDELTEKALLTGTSVCGALRNYLRERLHNFGVSEESLYKNKKGERLKQKDSSGNMLKDSNGKTINLPLPLITKLFGSIEDDGSQSLLIIDDSVSSTKPKTELRDGVRIDGKTRTAKDGAKFDLELLESGTEFPLRFELLITQENESAKTNFIKALATALQGFENKEIYLGGRKRRGYGECQVEGWKVKSYNLKDKNGLLDWLRNNDKSLNGITEQPIFEALEQQLQITVSADSDQRNYFELDAWFAIEGSMLIRSGSKVSEKYQPDAVHLRSKRIDSKKTAPIISGTSLAGVLRHRAYKIINTLSNEDKAKTITAEIFGDDDTKKKDKSASRLEVRETEIKNTNDLVQTRVKIDRFTGGAFDSALFDAAPVFSDGEQNAVNLKLRLRNAQPCEIGLILLLLKDLWTSDLAIGGESSIGRGRLKGKSACLIYKNGSGSWHTNLQQLKDEKNENKVLIDGVENNYEKIDLLNKFVEDFNERLNPKGQKNVK